MGVACCTETKDNPGDKNLALFKTNLEDVQIDSEVFESLMTFYLADGTVVKRLSFQRQESMLKNHDINIPKEMHLVKSIDHQFSNLCLQTFKKFNKFDPDFHLLKNPNPIMGPFLYLPIDDLEMVSNDEGPKSSIDDCYKNKPFYCMGQFPKPQPTPTFNAVNQMMNPMVNRQEVSNQKPSSSRVSNSHGANNSNSGGSLNLSKGPTEEEERKFLYMRILLPDENKIIDYTYYHDSEIFPPSLGYKGMVVLGSGDCLKGDYQEGCLNGEGRFESARGDVYQGYWQADKQHGYGSENWTDGNSYKGQYLNGFKDGYGEFSWSDGTFYKGQFSKNLIQGTGEYFWNDGKHYKGEWVGNMMEGQGTLIYPDKKEYRGEFVKDFRSGFGELFYPNGSFYKGYWKLDKEDGPGELRLPKGKIIKGNWRNGVLVGEADENGFKVKEDKF